MYSSLIIEASQAEHQAARASLQPNVVIRVKACTVVVIYRGKPGRATGGPSLSSTKCHHQGEGMLSSLIIEASQAERQAARANLQPNVVFRVKACSRP
jgi:hypothetical protein